MADALSRLPETAVQGEIHEMVVVQPTWLNEVLNSYSGDEWASKILEGLITKDPAFQLYSVNKGLIRMDGKIYVGSQGDCRKTILWELHDSPVGGHSGQETTIKKVTQFFHWPKMKAEIVEYIKACDECQRVKTGNQFPGGLLQPIPIPDQIWQHISLDFVEGLPKSMDKDCILVVIDRLSKVGHFIPLSHPFSATTVAQLFLDTIFRLHGMPLSIVSDRDKVFTSAFWKELFWVNRY